MQTCLLLGNFDSKKKDEIDFIKKSIRSAFNEMDGKVNLILSPKERLMKVNPMIVGSLKKAEKTGKFKIKKYKDETKKYEKLINKMFNHSGYLPEEYSILPESHIFYINKHRVNIHILPITHEMLYYDWKCKLLLTNSHLIHNPELMNEYIRLRTERVNITITELSKLLNRLDDNNLILLDDIYRMAIGLSTPKIILTNEKMNSINDIITEEVKTHKSLKTIF